MTGRAEKTSSKTRRKDSHGMESLQGPVISSASPPMISTTGLVTGAPALPAPTTQGAEALTGTTPTPGATVGSLTGPGPIVSSTLGTGGAHASVPGSCGNVTCSSSILFLNVSSQWLGEPCLPRLFHHQQSSPTAALQPCLNILRACPSKSVRCPSGERFSLVNREEGDWRRMPGQLSSAPPPPQPRHPLSAQNVSCSTRIDFARLVLGQQSLAIATSPAQSPIRHAASWSDSFRCTVKCRLFDKPGPKTSERH